jgi:hypothetical protein
MDETNDTQTEDATIGTADTAPEDASKEQAARVEDKPDRPKLTDAEQLAVLEGRAQRLRTKLGIKGEPSKEDSAKPDANGDLLQKTFLRAAQIAAEDEIDFALDKAKKWNLTVDKLVDDEDFKEALEKFRTKKSNQAATTEIRGNGATKQASQTPEYWIAKGTPPTASDVPDRKSRASIARSMIAASKNSKTFYNE